MLLVLKILTACRHSAVRPSMEYGGEIWEGNKGQVAALSWGGGGGGGGS